MAGSYQTETYLRLSALTRGCKCHTGCKTGNMDVRKKAMSVLFGVSVSTAPSSNSNHPSTSGTIDPDEVAKEYVYFENQEEVTT